MLTRCPPEMFCFKLPLAAKMKTLFWSSVDRRQSPFEGMLVLTVMLACPLITATHRTSLGQQPDQKQSALEVIESGRGGRHWVNEPTAAPQSPEASLAALHVESGYEVSLYAAEPLVMDSVSIAFDRRGRMFVAEYGDYPIGPEDGKPYLSRIVMLPDDDGDGKADRRVVFADGLRFAHSMMAYKDGLLVGAQDSILFLKDTDGDDVADQREVLFKGFTAAHPQMQIGNPVWGIDNWVYLNYGPGTIVTGNMANTKSTNADPITLPRKDCRFDPKTLAIEADSGMGQFGNTVDRWGHRFYCTNRNPIITTALPPKQLARNPFHTAGESFYDVAASGGDSLVFPKVAMKSNYLSHAGTHTSACGTTAYLGSLGDAGFQASVFVCEPIGHLVTRSIVDTSEPRFRASRARPKADFIASTDTWFRPASLATGPDDALYLADMYRLWVEHPKFLPEEIAAQLDWRAGDDRGRIYRIVPKGQVPRNFQPATSTDDLVDMLCDSNGWRQFLAQRLLVERGNTDAVSLIRRKLDDKQATTRLHACWTLAGLNALTQEDIVRLLSDAHPECLIAALQASVRLINEPTVASRVIDLTQHSSSRVRRAAVIALSDNQSGAATDALFQAAKRDGQQPMFVDALMTSVSKRSGAVLERLLSDQAFRAATQVSSENLIHTLASCVGARGDETEVANLLSLLNSQPTLELRWQAALVSGLGQGLPRYQGPLGRLSLRRLVTDSQSPAPKLPWLESADSISQCMQQCSECVLDREQPLGQRVAAMKLLAFADFDRNRQAFVSTLSSSTAPQLQQACLDALSAHATPETFDLIIDSWNQIGASVRPVALQLLLRRTNSLQKLLDAMQRGDIAHSMLSVDWRVRLLRHRDQQIAAQAAKLFGGAVSANRQQVAAKYQPALTLSADVKRGQQIFRRVCAACHMVDGDGKSVGPDLSDTRNRSSLALLHDILDPNDKVEPRFNSYTLLTVDGQVFTGLVESENEQSVVLRMSEGKRNVIGRAQIEQIQSNDLSLMPEGIEKDVSLQEMADLLAFLKRRQ